MAYNSYEIKRGIQFILNNKPHNINALMHFYNNREISNYPAKISLEFILSNSSWTIDEKNIY